ncbi:MAG: DUF4112 domain-containing protein [Paracoccaceae bacterium]|nr:DUF4112 domain-containing protein [Loktanella sp.]
MDRLERLERVAHRMDSLVRIPGTRFRIGLDGMLGIIPGIGDALAMAPAGYIIHQSYKMGAPRSLLARMAINTGVDTVIGTIPLVGDLFDIGNKSNNKNVALLRKHLERERAAQKDGPSDIAAQ